MKTPIRNLGLLRCVLFCVLVISIVSCSFTHPSDVTKSSDSCKLKSDECAIRLTINTIKRPTNPYQFLSNIRFAVEHELFLYDELYTVENLKRLFGANEVDVNQSLHYANGDVSHMEDVFEFGKENFGEGLEFSFGAQSAIEQNKKSMKLVAFGQTGLTYDSRMTNSMVAEIFGQPDAIEDAKPSGFHWNDAIGKKDITYKFEGKKTIASVRFRISVNGWVNNVTYRQEEK